MFRGISSQAALTAAGTAILALAVTGAATAQDNAGAEAGKRSKPAEKTAAAYQNPDWEPPKTAWGHPDLQGVWTSDDMRSVPMNRPKEMGERQYLTPEDFKERAEKDRQARARAVNKQGFLRTEHGVRSFGYTSFVVDPADGQVPELTDWAKTRQKKQGESGTFGTGPFDTVEDFTMYDRCISRGVIGSILPVLYGNGLRIVQTPNEVVITYEMIHDTRIIPLDGRPHIDNEIRPYMGNARGHWEGNTLVIETTNLTDKLGIGPNGGGVPHSKQMKITERLTRIDPEMINYVARIEDPKTYKAPFTIRLTITQQPDYRLYEYACHEGNQAVRNTLSGERAYEKRVRAAKRQGKPVPERDIGEGQTVYETPDDKAEIETIGQ